MTDVRDFWETVAQGYLSSLESPYAEGLPQYRFLLRKFVGTLTTKTLIADVVDKLIKHKSAQLKKDIGNVLVTLSKQYSDETRKYQDAIRSLICLNSTDFGIANTGSAWLQGLEIDDDLAKELSFQRKKAEPREIVRAISWLMSLAGPTILAFDQLDPIVHQLARQNEIDNLEEQNTARWIIDQIGNGLGALRDTTTRTMNVVSCLETTHVHLSKEILASNIGRFNEPIRLKSPLIAHYEPLIESRMAMAYQVLNFTPPYSTWPFKSEEPHLTL
jgi:hypothetical protein